jgi:hypothetical protein
MTNEIFHTDDIKTALNRELSICTNEIRMLTAFAKVSALRFIDSQILNSKVKKKLLVRFRLEDIRQKSTDFEIYQYCLSNGWELFINFDLHSKLFVFDSKRFMLGSANLTLSGLGLKSNPNIESVFCGNINSDQDKRIDEFFKESILVDETIIENMKHQIDSLEAQPITLPSWNKDVAQNFNQNNDNLWMSDFLQSISPFDMYSCDLSLLGLRRTEITNLDLVRNKFKKLKIYRWLQSNVDSEMYFGEVTNRLHTAIIDSPTPYRKDIKQLLSNLYNWIEELEIDEFYIDRPKHSQRITRK